MQHKPTTSQLGLNAPREFYTQIDTMKKVMDEVSRKSSSIIALRSDGLSEVRTALAEMTDDLSALQAAIEEHEKNREEFTISPELKSKQKELVANEEKALKRLEEIKAKKDSLEKIIQAMDLKIAELEEFERNALTLASASQDVKGKQKKSSKSSSTTAQNTIPNPEITAKETEIANLTTQRKAKKNARKLHKKKSPERAKLNAEIADLQDRIKSLKVQLSVLPETIQAPSDAAQQLSRLLNDRRDAEKSLTEHNANTIAEAENLQTYLAKTKRTKDTYDEVVNRSRGKHSCGVSNQVMFFCIRLYARVMNLQTHIATQIAKKATDKLQTLSDTIGKNKKAMEECLIGMWCPKSSNKNGMALYYETSDKIKEQLLESKPAADLQEAVVPTIIISKPDLSSSGNSMAAARSGTAIAVDLTSSNSIASSAAVAVGSHPEGLAHAATADAAASSAAAAADLSARRTRLKQRLFSKQGRANSDAALTDKGKDKKHKKDKKVRRDSIDPVIGAIAVQSIEPIGDGERSVPLRRPSIMVARSDVNDVLQRSASVSDISPLVSPALSVVPSLSGAQLRVSTPSSMFRENSLRASAASTPASAEDLSDNSSGARPNSASSDRPIVSASHVAAQILGDAEERVDTLQKPIPILHLPIKTVSACMYDFMSKCGSPDFTQDASVSSVVNADLNALKMAYLELQFQTERDPSHLRQIIIQHEVVKIAEKEIERIAEMPRGCFCLWAPPELKLFRKAYADVLSSAEADPAKVDFGKLSASDVDALRKSGLAIVTARYANKPALEQAVTERNGDGRAVHKDRMLLYLRIYELMLSMRENMDATPATPRAESKAHIIVRECAQALFTILHDYHCGKVNFSDAHNNYLNLSEVEQKAFLDGRQTTTTVASLLTCRTLSTPNTPTGQKNSKTPRHLASETPGTPGTPGSRWGC